MKAPQRTRPKIAMALAGGGPLGAIYEIGALCALDESLGASTSTDWIITSGYLRGDLLPRRLPTE